ncbi:MAG: pitrilysin family protein [Acidobacteriia bacterium]|nr:pitrilysin family protein [Terriglobia bacterium]
MTLLDSTRGIIQVINPFRLSAVGGYVRVGAASIRMEDIHKTILDNGLTIVTESIPHVRSVALGVWLRSGSRRETKDQNGIAHFIEHMLFKGTTKRSAEEIARNVDSIGGNLDAFTAKECTSFSIKVLDEHLPLAVDIVSDLVLHPRLDPRDIEKEKDVIREEIKMVEDTPDDLVHEIFIQNFWKNHPLGWPILGTENTLAGIHRAPLQRYFRECYVPENMVIAAAGRLNHSRLVEALERKFSRLPKAPAPASSPAPKSYAEIHLKPKNSLEQIHLCLGVPSYPMAHPKRHACYVLNVILGGGMSSRLFQNIREKRGLAYSVFSNLDPYSDTGCFSIYAATAPASAGKTISLIVQELRKSKRTLVEKEELRRAKDHLKGGLVLGLESTGSRMGNLARQELYFGSYTSIQELMRNVERVSAEEVREVARDSFHSTAIALSLVGKLNGLRVERDILEC